MEDKGNSPQPLGKRGYQGLRPNSLSGSAAGPPPFSVFLFPFIYLCVSFSPASLASSFTRPIFGPLFPHLGSPCLARLPLHPSVSWLFITQPLVLHPRCRTSRLGLGPEVAGREWARARIPKAQAPTLSTELFSPGSAWRHEPRGTSTRASRPRTRALGRTDPASCGVGGSEDLSWFYFWPGWVQ